MHRRDGLICCSFPGWSAATSVEYENDYMSRRYTSFNNQLAELILFNHQFKCDSIAVLVPPPRLPSTNSTISIDRVELSATLFLRLFLTIVERKWHDNIKSNKVHHREVQSIQSIAIINHQHQLLPLPASDHKQKMMQLNTFIIYALRVTIDKVDTIAHVMSIIITKYTVDGIATCNDTWAVINGQSTKAIYSSRVIGGNKWRDHT